MADQTKKDMIATIVASFASRPDATPDAIVELYNRLMDEAGEETGTPAPQGTAVPALPLDRAVTEDKVYCLCCGRGFKMLKRHLGAEHGLTEAEYRAMFGLPADFPLVAPNYSRKKASHAKQAGFGKYDRGVHRQDSDA
ncbi:putative mucR family transcriptional regulatory protein [Pseudooceanicola batsensis HTCC2597]|uniref:Putative mucR family transcriptional regulatory protein n=1 Tax=Pseudooceanicola batsensis (strain ATCC BAA-863 / DSM 15984 / KCTC 12145 / HTCC2597) TaxID=252305 RepID=A3U114_PSEBH|nr:MucR family transcriptional regulator [Pseudooceanicola batsensis]EAQ01997.1 putative mucR family transcriptional regulatory protein [Pseudooceanicola batsensis HTCC2597]